MADAKEWSVAAAAELIRIAYSKPNARELIAQAVCEIWDNGRTHGFERGQQSVIDFQAVLRNSLTRQS